MRPAPLISMQTREPAASAPARRGAGHVARRLPGILAGLAPFGALQVLVFWIPLALFFSFAFLGPADPWSELVASSAKLQSIARTFAISLETTVLCGLLAYIYVGALLRASPLWRSLLLIAVVVPFLTSIVVRTYAWIIVLGGSGPINVSLRWLFGPEAGVNLLYTRTGVLIGMVHVLLPLFVLPLYAVMNQIPRNLGRAARTLGANRVRAFMAVDLPLSLPGAATGAVLVFIQALGFFVTPAMLGGLGDTMVAQFIDSDMRRFGNLGSAAVMSVVLVTAVLVCVLAFRAFYPLELLFVQRSGDGAVAGPYRSSRSGGPGRVRRGLERVWAGVAGLLDLLPWGWITRLGAALIALYFVLPLAVVIPVSLIGESYLHFPPESYSLRWYEAVLADPDWRLAAWNSLLVGALAVAITVPAGAAFAFVVVRAPLAAGLKGGLIAALVLPAVVPVIVLSVGVYVWYLDLQWIASRVSLSVAHAVLALPFAALILVAALRDFDLRVEQAARSLGAGPLRTMLYVTLPILLGPLVMGALLTFLTSFDELLIARAVTNYQTLTLPVKLWNGANEEISPALAVVSTVSLALALGAALTLMALGARRARRLRSEH